MSGDKEQDYFADGITDDLTTDLSHLPESFVIARNTAFTYEGKNVDARQIGKDLGVRYLLEGSVRRLGEKVEINAQLISTETGAHVWADRFEGERSKLGELQVDIVSRLARMLGVELVKAEALRSMRERPNNPDAADLAMRSRAKYLDQPSYTKSANSEVIDLSQRALALDPQNESAMVDSAMAFERSRDQSMERRTRGRRRTRGQTRRLRFGPSAGRCAGPHGEGGDFLQQTSMESGNISG
jgi:adenylate cyclase